MKKLFIFFFVICLAPAFAVDEELELKTDRALRCDVRTYFAYTTTRDRCTWRDDVMVGVASVDPLTIRCARLEVTCQKREDAKSEKEE